MSYINQALQKAQKENESSYAAYDRIIGASAGKARRPARRVLLAGVLILVGLVAVAGALYKAKKEPPLRPVEEKRANIDSPTLFAKAVKKQNEGKLMEAKELYRKVIKKDPRNVQALNNLGVIYMSRKIYKWALIRFNDALAIKPDYAEVHYNLACLYSMKKDVARSFHYLQTAIQLNPDVRQWAKKDRDLQELRRFPDFNNLLEEPEN